MLKLTALAATALLLAAHAGVAQQSGGAQGGGAQGGGVQGGGTRGGDAAGGNYADIQTLVVIYAENRSFDNLFGTFPGANGLANASREFDYPA